MNFAIDNPIGGTFSVVIKNSSGTTVYSATHGNETFDPGITTPGSYVLYIDDAIGFCFDVPVCECPPFTSATIILGGLTYSGLFSFTYDSPDDFCPFDILIRTEFTGGMFGTIPINSLSDLVAAPSGVYTKTISLGGVGFMEYKIKTQSSDEVCVSGTVTYDCVPPTIESVDLAYSEELGYYLKIISTVCGCGSYTANYVQTYPSTSYSGGSSRVIDCESLPDTFIIPITPIPDASGRVEMTVTITDCCRGETEYLLDILPPCSGPTLPTAYNIVLIGSQYYMRVTFPSCGGTCQEVGLLFQQNNLLTVGSNDFVGPVYTSLSCSDTYPLTIDYPIMPNTNIVSSQSTINYVVIIGECCGDSSIGIRTYPKP